MEAQLLVRECRKAFPNMNGGASRWAVDFLPSNFKPTMYISPCAHASCGRSGYCYAEGEPNKHCGPTQHYAFRAE